MTKKSSLELEYQAQLEIATKADFSPKDLDLNIIRQYQYKFASFYDKCIMYFDNKYFINLFAKDAKDLLVYSSITPVATDFIKDALSILALKKIILSESNIPLSTNLIETILLKSEILKLAFKEAGINDIHMMIGAIDSLNSASIKLHKDLNFEFCGTVKEAGFKFGKWLDVSFYQLILKSPAAPIDG